MGNAESSVSRPNGAPSIISPSSAWSAADQLRKSLEGEHTRKSGEHVRESGEHVRKSAEVDEHTPAQEQQEDFGEGHPPEESETDMPEESPVLPVQAENVDTAQAEDTPVESHHVQMRREPSSQGSIAKSESEMEKPEEPPAPPIQVEDVETRQAEDTQVEGHHVQMRREPSSQGTTAKPEEASEPQKTEEATHESIIHGTYTLVSMRANTAAMDLSGGDNKSIISFPVHGGVNQQWSIMPLAHGPERSYTIRSAVSGLYLTIEPDAGTGAVKVVGNEFPASWVVDEVTSGGGAQERVVRIGWPRSGLVVGFAEGEGETPGHKVGGSRTRDKS
ncbi:carbohydrate-binding module family 13 protein [Neolentinus lepideus HHB14362 ss-1]|uniref:Carbohydrate-binding module family 13 protein n=1 Tax=Neolentinus lepideus HHB14362 ss-1 TaxID=1314782 RepID=A0A165VRL2_9AGAM|nr:carbohydrate-binding module family 13 protein [Neolentinus lepideus HHB14362 ss-1]